MNIVCIKHPKYDGKSSPELSCKACCSKYIHVIRSEKQKEFVAWTPTLTPEAKARLDQAKRSIDEIFNETRNNTNQRRGYDRVDPNKRRD